MCYRRYIQYQNISVAVTSLIISVNGYEWDVWLTRRVCRSGFRTDERSGRSRGRVTPCSTPPPPSCPPTPSRPWAASPPSPPPGRPTATQVEPSLSFLLTGSSAQVSASSLRHSGAAEASQAAVQPRTLTGGTEGEEVGQGAEQEVELRDSRGVNTGHLPGYMTETFTISLRM